MVKPELGIKRQCMSCGAKFFDLNRDPIICPKCGTTYQVTAVTTALRGAAPVAARRKEVEEEEVETADVELVSLEDAEAEETKAEVADDDVDLAEDVGEDDTFLEEEEEGDDDVSDLIDGDIEDDEET